jgi:hypothetical protein
MSKIIKGSKDQRRYDVLKGPKDTRQMRCRKCHGLAIQQPDGKGGYIYICSGCGTPYRFTTI